MSANRSAACGAWRLHDGSYAHSHCNGSVSLPDGVCSCICHLADQRAIAEGYADEDEFVTRAREWNRLVWRLEDQS